MLVTCACSADRVLAVLIGASRNNMQQAAAANINTETLRAPRGPRCSASRAGFRGSHAGGHGHRDERRSDHRRRPARWSQRSASSCATPELGGRSIRPWTSRRHARPLRRRSTTATRDGDERWFSTAATPIRPIKQFPMTKSRDPRRLRLHRRRTHQDSAAAPARARSPPSRRGRRTPPSPNCTRACSGGSTCGCEPFDADRLGDAACRCAFGCLPHGASMATLPPLLERGVRVIDLSADYRLRDPNVYAEWYGESAQRPREPRPGGLRPAGTLRRRDRDGPAGGQPRLLPADGDPRPGAARGGQAHRADGHRRSTARAACPGPGGRRSCTRTSPSATRASSAYAVGTHRHTPEIEQALADVAGEPVSGDLHAAPDADGPRHLHARSTRRRRGP